VIAQQGERTVEAKVEALMENLAVSVMQANNLAAASPEYGRWPRRWPTRSISRSWACQPNPARSIFRTHRGPANLALAATKAVARARTRGPLPCSWTP
jgi:hypothetical protein